MTQTLPCGCIVDADDSGPIKVLSACPTYPPAHEDEHEELMSAANWPTYQRQRRDYARNRKPRQKRTR